MLKRLSSNRLPPHTISLAPRGSPFNTALLLLALGALLAVSWPRSSSARR